MCIIYLIYIYAYTAIFMHTRLYLHIHIYISKMHLIRGLFHLGLSGGGTTVWNQMQLKQLLRKLSETINPPPQLHCNISYTIVQQVSQLFSALSGALQSGKFVRSLAVFKDHPDNLVFLDHAVSMSFLQVTGLSMVFLNFQPAFIYRQLFAYFMLHSHSHIACTGFVESKYQYCVSAFSFIS